MTPKLLNTGHFGFILKGYSPDLKLKVALRFSGVNFVSLNFIDYVSMALCMGDNRVGDTSDLLDLPQEVGLGRRGSFWRLRLDSSLWFVIVAHPNFVCWAGAAPQAGRRLLGWHKIGRSGRYGRLRAPSKRFSASHMKYILRLVNFSWAPSRKLAPASIFVFVGIA